MLVETRDPTEVHRLECGDRLTIPPPQPHRVRGENDGRCRFVIVQGVGTYDYVPD